MSYKIFIDGEAGTTGLQVRERLLTHPDAELIHLADADRKDASHRRDAMAAADAVILCLPDDSAMEAVDMASGMDCRIIDASTAHRTADGWVYGFPELTAGQRDRIAASRHIANVGCYASAMIAMIRPLTEHHLLSPDANLSVSAVSGYSGGGKALISYMDTHPDDADTPHHFAYGLNLNHKHLPEVMMHGGLNKPPVFTPMVGDFYAGMLVHLPLHADQFNAAVDADQLYQLYADWYAGAALVRMGAACANDENTPNMLAADALADTDSMEIFVFSDAQARRFWLVARLDNLGKGASGAAVQNMNIALGIDEAISLA